MKIGVIGGGTVGRATARCWQEHCDEVRVWDINLERCTHLLAEVSNCDITFICVPEDRLEQLLQMILSGGNASRYHESCNFVLKSTVPVGTTRRLRDQYKLINVVHSPEFLTERCAMTDVQVPARNIIGADRSGSLDCECLLSGMYLNRFPGVHTYHMTFEESELVKLACNAYFATKVSFFNEVHGLADVLDMDWDRVLAGIVSDGRIGSSHTMVPGPDGLRGFGGKCLPKDLETLKACMMEAGLVPDLLLGVQESNLFRRGE